MTATVVAVAGVVPGITRGWVRVYCAGMTAEAGRTRMIEIESDLWEHYTDGAGAVESAAATNLEVLGRMLRGIPSDLAWRFQAEGFHMNIQIPVERLAGLLLLLLVIPFIAGVSINGYDMSQDEWPSEFRRFADISSNTREATGLLHAFAGLLVISSAALFFAVLRERSPRLVTTGCALLSTAGVIMLVNAAVYRAMSALADDFLATGDPSIVTTARGFGIALEGLTIANMAASVTGILLLSVVLTRLGLVPRWTMAFPTVGLMAAVGLVTLGSADPLPGEFLWLFFALGLLSVALWLLFCGVWLLLGGAARLTPLGEPRTT